MDRVLPGVLLVSVPSRASLLAIDHQSVRAPFAQIVLRAAALWSTRSLRKAFDADGAVDGDNGRAFVDRDGLYGVVVSRVAFDSHGFGAGTGQGCSRLGQGIVGLGRSAYSGPL